MRIKKSTFLKSINLKTLLKLKLYLFTKIRYFIHAHTVARFLKNWFYLRWIRHLKNNTERTRISRWLGRENEEIECGVDEKFLG